MRLQLIFFLFLSSFIGLAQQPDSSTVKVAEDIEVDFLMSYYHQDGNHSAVTGGQGSELLQDYAGVLVVNVPLDSARSLTVKGGITYYTSASNDNIDFRVSSASRKEYRGDLDVSLTKSNRSRGVTRKYSFGTSLDVDYLSTSLGYGWSKLWPQRNRQLSIEGKFYYDTWIWLVYPFELRGTDRANAPSNKRLTYNLGVNYSWTINERTQAAIIADPTYQHGLLSTPFHRVFFADSLGTFLEKLPLDRFKLPVALRLHYFAGDLITFRFYYRYYWDSFGLRGHTVNMEIPIKFSTAFTMFPYYRYHTQTAADYFRPFQQHLFGVAYYTSDFDLSDLQSHRYGLGLRVTPLYGIAGLKWSKKKQLELAAIEMRFSVYRRSDGLEAFTVTVGSSLLIH